MSSVSVDPKQVEWFLTHAVETVYPTREALRERLVSGQKLTVYHGIDPTGPTLHLGHTVPLRKLSELQKLGHKVILLIGDFTAMIGDPTDKAATRKKLTREEVLENCKLYKQQAAFLLDFDGPNAAEFRFNSEWLAKMSFADVVELASHFTVQQMMERDMFEKRFRGAIICPKCSHQFSSPVAISFVGPTSEHEDRGTGNLNVHPSILGLNCPKCSVPLKEYVESNPSSFLSNNIIKPRPIHLHEFFYPLMQGYDSVALEVDLEIGGNDQTFNMLAGRTLLKTLKQKEKFVLTNRLLADPTGKKMGKSEGNMLALTDEPNDAYGKVMSWTDEMIIPGFEICTQKTGEGIQEVKAALEHGENPIVWKKELARLVVEGIFGEKAANEAAGEFVRVHSKGEKPEEMQILELERQISLAGVLIEAGFVTSTSDARRQIEQGGVRVNDEVITDVKAQIDPNEGEKIIQKGKRHFVKVVKK